MTAGPALSAALSLRQQVFHAVAEGRRREILDLLAGSGPLRAGDIAARFPQISRPAVSRHLRVLRDAGLVAARREAQAGPASASDGREQWYSARPERLTLVLEWIRRYELFWADKLDELERLLDSDAADNVAGGAEPPGEG